MKCSDFCLRCKELKPTEIQELFWYYYNRKNILKIVLYSLEFLTNNFPAYSKEHLMNQLQYLYNELKYEHLCSAIRAMEPWTEQEEINFLYLYYFLIDQNKKMITLENFLKLKPLGFEKFIFRVFKNLDYSDLSLTSYSRDGGFDIRAKKDDILVLGECKKFSPKKKIGVKDISRLADAVRRKKAQKGIFVTTSSFTQGCYREQKERDVEIEFWDGQYLMKLIRNELNLLYFMYK